MDYNKVLLIPSIILQSVLLTSPTMKVTGQRILASPVSPPKSCLVEASGCIHGNIVGMRQMKRPSTIIAADISFLLVGIFFKRRNLEKRNDNSPRKSLNIEIITILTNCSISSKEWSETPIKNEKIPSLLYDGITSVRSAFPGYATLTSHHHLPAPISWYRK